MLEKNMVFSYKTFFEAVPYLRRLFAVFSLRRPGFAPRPVYFGFMLDKMTLRQVFLRILRFFPVRIIPPLFHIHSYILSSGGWTKGPIEAQLHRDMVSPHRNNDNNYKNFLCCNRLLYTSSCFIMPIK
jgi:hypothetical protein